MVEIFDIVQPSEKQTPTLDEILEVFRKFHNGGENLNMHYMNGDELGNLEIKRDDAGVQVTLRAKRIDLESTPDSQRLTEDDMLILAESDTHAAIHQDASYSAHMFIPVGLDIIRIRIKYYDEYSTGFDDTVVDLSIGNSNDGSETKFRDVEQAQEYFSGNDKELNMLNLVLAISKNLNLDESKRFFGFSN